MAPAGSEDTGGTAIEVGFASITFRIVLVLALDTTARAGSVAVFRDGRVIVEQPGNPGRTHGERLPGELMAALDRASARLADVDLFAVAAGPGSFTGLRVGIATRQGLAVAGERRIVGVSALEALARAARDGQALVAPWMDAQRGEVFAALYASDGRALVIEPSSASPERTLDAWSPPAPARPLRFIGDGAIRYRDLLRARLPDVEVIDTVPPLAGLIARIAAEEPERATLPHAVVPIYIRRSDAELARARRNG